MSNYEQEDYYPTEKVYEIFGKYASGLLEQAFWHSFLKESLDILSRKLGSPRLTNLHELWYSGFEDLELKKLEHSLLAVQIVVTDIMREDKEFRLWKLQYRYLKDIFCEVDDILDDMALRAPYLKELLQSPQVTPHPYLTDKLVQINNFILGLNSLAAEIRSIVFPELNTRRRKAPGPKPQSNFPLPIPSHNIHSHQAAIPGADDISVYYSFLNTQGNVSDTSHGVPAKTNEKIIPHSYDFTTESMDLRKNRATGSMDSRKNQGTESVEPRKNWNAYSMDRRESRVTDNINTLEEPLISYEPNTTTSIDDLPKHLKKCILYVSLFPTNYKFEKEILVQMWIAVGYIQSEGKKLMEDTAGGYFDELLSMALFEVSPLDESSYIIPDNAYNMIRKSAGAEYARLEDGNLNGISTGTLHASVLFERTVDPMIYKSFNKLKELHSLLLLQENRRYIKQIPDDLMLSLGCIRVLDLSGMQLTELPTSVGNMKTLHYLDLSGTRIRSLPGSISCLSRLQVLRLRDCSSLVELPENMRNIINLRHLDLDIIRQLTFLPPGIGRLTKLQTLSAYIARKEKGFQIAELKNMINLRGSLSIINLENVGTLEEAEEAALSNKVYLHKLVFQWSMPCLNAEEVLEGLEPNKNLTDLEIICYGSSTFPAWLGDSSFSKLANINIYNCRNAILLPLLGLLPSLKTLRIAEMDILDGIDEFSQGDSNSLGFPKLETLEFDGMRALEELTGLPENGMPRLHTLTLVDCPNLVSLPKLSKLKSLQRLEISFCFKLLTLGEERLPISLQTLRITTVQISKKGIKRQQLIGIRLKTSPTFGLITNLFLDRREIQMNLLQTVQLQCKHCN